MRDTSGTAVYQPANWSTVLRNRAEAFAEAYAAAYAIAVKASGPGGEPHFAALKAMELADK